MSNFSFVQDLALSETKRAEASLKEERSDAEIEIKTLKKQVSFLLSLSCGVLTYFKRLIYETVGYIRMIHSVNDTFLRFVCF